MIDHKWVQILDNLISRLSCNNLLPAAPLSMIEDERRTSPLHCFILAMNMQIASHTSDHLANESWCSWLGWCRCCRGPRLVRPRNVRGRALETRPGCLRNSPPHRWRQPILTYILGTLVHNWTLTSPELQKQILFSQEI